jgi:predicted ABC-type ATPase
MHELAPIMYVFAGNNGSGKGTIRKLIVDELESALTSISEAHALPESRKILKKPHL